MYGPLNDFIYSSDPMIEELTIEANARDDYLAELAASHADHYAHLEAEEIEFVGPPAPFFFGVTGERLDLAADIPF